MNTIAIKELIPYIMIKFASGVKELLIFTHLGSVIRSIMALYVQSQSLILKPAVTKRTDGMNLSL